MELQVLAPLKERLRLEAQSAPEFDSLVNSLSKAFVLALQFTDLSQRFVVPATATSSL